MYLIISPSFLTLSSFDTAYECPENSIYSVNVSPCQPTCADPDFSSNCPLMDGRVEGCKCNDGLVMMDGKCVDPSTCPTTLGEWSDTARVVMEANLLLCLSWNSASGLVNVSQP